MRNAYRDMVTIQQDSSLGGAPVPDYSGSALMAAVPCSVTARGGNEAYRGRMLEAHVTHIVECQYIEGVTPTMRLYVTGGIHSGKYLNVEYANVFEGGGRARKLELHCVENVGR